MRGLVLLALLVALVAIAPARKTAELEEKLEDMIEELLEYDKIKRGEDAGDGSTKDKKKYIHPYDADALQRQNSQQVNNKEKSKGGSRKKRQTSCVWDTKPTCDAAASYRTADGSCNNLVNTNWGQAATAQQRFADVYYEDGYSTPRSSATAEGTTLPLARAISVVVHGDDTINDFSAKSLTHMTMQWGQFLAHDIVSTPEATADKICCWDDLDATFKATTSQEDLDADELCMSIPLPANEAHFTDKTCLNFVRSKQVTPLDCVDSHKEQLNSLTAWIDASNVYGSTDDYMNSLRTFSGGKLIVSDDDLLPHDVDGLNCVKDTADDPCFRAGDARVNVSPGLMSMHAIWAREHNNVSIGLALQNTEWDDEKLFQESRRIVGAEMQHITYREYLPIILGSDATSIGDLRPENKGQVDNYDQTTNPSIYNEFAVAAFRFGHSMIQSMFSRISNEGVKDATPLSELYGRTKYVTENFGEGLDKLVNGLVKDAPQKADDWYSTQISNLLFGAGDLAARNLQRGRDQGAPSYNNMRKWCGLEPATEFTNLAGGFIDMRETLPPKLNRIYEHPDDVDLYTGGVLELAKPRAVIGPTFACIIKKQFEALRNGDRFFYERPDATVGFTERQTDVIKRMSLAQILCRNTGIAEIQTNPFAQPRNRNTVVPCTTFSELDLSEWKE